MAKTITEAKNYLCTECRLSYKERLWAKKCEAWCKEHQSCNLEITKHAIKTRLEIEEPLSEKLTNNKNYPKILTVLFYVSIGTASSLALFLALYWSLSLNSSITNFISNTIGEPFYFWPYVVLTFGAIVLFGINVPLLVYQIRKVGFSKLKQQAGTGLGSLVGIAASACPICGSTILSAIGIAGGLAVLPLQGLELKAVSFGLMAIPLWLNVKELRKHQCNKDGDILPHLKHLY